MMVFYDDIVCVIAKVYTVKIYAYNEPINFYSVPKNNLIDPSFIIKELNLNV